MRRTLKLRHSYTSTIKIYLYASRHELLDKLEYPSMYMVTIGNHNRYTPCQIHELSGKTGKLIKK